MKDFYNETYSGIEADRKLKEETKAKLKYAVKNERNHQAQTNVKPKSRRKLSVAITSIAMAFVMGIGVGAYFIFRGPNNPNNPGDPSNPLPNWELAAIVNERAINAQYLPEASKLVTLSDTSEKTQGVSSLGISPITSDIEEQVNGMTLEEYNELIKEIGSIWHPYQGDFNILDAKDIIVYLTEYVGIFDSWFRYRGTNRSGSQEDFENIPEGVADGDFYMTMNEETEHIKIIQKMGFQPWIWDSELNKFVMNYFVPEGIPNKPSDITPYYSVNWPVLGETVLEINYYYIGEGENKVEVVEAEIVEFYNVYNEVVIVGHQSIRNIKDRSFTRYIFDCTESMWVTDVEGYEGGHAAEDFRNAVSNGRDRTFLHIDYTDASNVSILRIETSLAQGLVNYSDFTNGISSLYELMFLGDILGFEIDDAYLYEDGAVDYVGDAIISMMLALNLPDEVISLFDPREFAVNKSLENATAVCDILDMVAQILVERSYLVNNYEQGMKIRIIEAPDVTEQFHPELNRIAMR